MSRKMIAALQVSLDGFTQDSAEGEPEWVESWADALQLIPDVDAFILGAGMYPDYGEYWQSVYENPKTPAPGMRKPPLDRDVAYAKRAADTPHYVLSTKLKSVSWPSTARVVSKLDELRALKAQPGKNFYVVGGPTLVSSLLNENLLDELRLIVHPLLRGGGLPLFGGVKNWRWLKFVEAQPSKAGRLVVTYRTSPEL